MTLVLYSNARFDAIASHMEGHGRVVLYSNARFDADEHHLGGEHQVDLDDPMSVASAGAPLVVSRPCAFDDLGSVDALDVQPATPEAIEPAPRDRRPAVSVIEMPPVPRRGRRPLEEGIPRRRHCLDGDTFARHCLDGVTFASAAAGESGESECPGVSFASAATSPRGLLYALPQPGAGS
jgi:hypothetical protein